jgi:CO dehydrogenase/acetyl-CoA synthase epsilon subunit
MFDDEKVETVEQVEQPVEQPVQPVVETPGERNFKALVEKNKRLERERDEAIRLAQEKQAAKVAEKVEELEEEINIGNDEIAEGKHLKQVTKAINKLKEELRQYKQSSTAMSEEAQLKSQYPDIEKVVSKENLDALREQDPDFAAMLGTSTNFKAKVISAYKHIKHLGIHVEDTYQAEREMAQKNAAKPKPLASVSPQQGDSPLSKANAFANGLTPDLKKQLLKEMQEARNSQ